GETNPQRHVAGETPRMSLGKDVNVVVGEVKALGHVFLHQMYPFEDNGVLKKYVRNRFRPAGSIVEGYTTKEVVKFCRVYLKGIDNTEILCSRHQADSDTAQRFATWMGVEVGARVSYLKASVHKNVLLRKMNEYHRKFKTNLTHITQEGKDPVLIYKDLNMDDWPAFVAIRNSPTFKVYVTLCAIEGNAPKNTDRHTMGRSSYVRLEKNLVPVMQDLERRYPEIAKLECRRSKLHIFGRLSANDFTSLKGLTNSLYDQLKALLEKEQEMKADGRLGDTSSELELGRIIYGFALGDIKLGRIYRWI
nr:hypothetical protein [Tanacetum cinerariifolium]